jgi:hypothetical protein
VGHQGKRMKSFLSDCEAKPRERIKAGHRTNRADNKSFASLTHEQKSRGNKKSFWMKWIQWSTDGVFI